MPSLTSVESSYENVGATCPACGFKNIYNRHDDLRDVEPIAKKTVRCQERECQREFAIGGDSVNEAYEQLVFDTFDLTRQKQYMRCVLNVAQAYEVFFSTFLRVHFAYRPYGSDQDQGLTKLNECLEMLYEVTKKLTFDPLRSIFIRLILGQDPADLSKSSAEIPRLHLLTDVPKDAMIAAHPDKSLRDLLLKLKHVSANELRNRVVHSQAYRPTRTEVENELEEARSVLLVIGHELDVHDNPNWYLT